MKKKTNLLALIPVISIAVGLVASYVKLSLSAQDAKEKVIKLETDTKVEIDKVKTDIKEKEAKDKEELEEVKKDNQEIDKSLTEMRVEQRYLQQSVIDLNNNVKELVQEIKEDRKKKK